jgi:BirA family biotin operon repressor/biotin-[acetyl-CoA-carboxylase] ligase
VLPGLSLPSPFRLLAFEHIDSTNEEARRLAVKGAAHGTVVQAATQTEGRGRRGRRWDSPPGNLYCSLVLRPDCALGEAANVSFVAAVAVGEAIDPWLCEGVELGFKWPNDVLLSGRKAAGFLLESSAAGGRCEWLVLGLGVNLERFPEGTAFPATSLRAERCRPVTVGELLEGVCRRFGEWYGRWRADGFGPVRAAWLGRAVRLGRTIEVRTDSERLTGRFADLDSRGALILEVPGGTRREVTAGDVFFPAARAGAGG